MWNQTTECLGTTQPSNACLNQLIVSAGHDGQMVVSNQSTSCLLVPSRQEFRVPEVFTLPSPLALLAWAMLVGGGARDRMGAAASAAGPGAFFTKSFLNSATASRCYCLLGSHAYMHWVYVPVWLCPVQLFAISNRLIKFRNVNPTLEILERQTQKRLGTVKPRFYIVEMF